MPHIVGKTMAFPDLKISTGKHLFWSLLMTCHWNKGQTYGLLSKSGFGAIHPSLSLHFIHVGPVVNVQAVWMTHARKCACMPIHTHMHVHAHTHACFP